jgi:hypothetical protein
MPANPAHSVRGPRHSVTNGVTPVLSSEEATALLTGIDVSSIVGLRDRAIIAVSQRQKHGGAPHARHRRAVPLAGEAGRSSAGLSAFEMD